MATDPHAGFFQAAEEPYECVIVSTGFADFDPLRLCSQLRSLDRTRFLPIILLADEGEDERIIRGLELGINDYLDPADRPAGADRAAAHPGQAQALQRPSARQRHPDASRWR